MWQVDRRTGEHVWSDETYRILGIEKKDAPPTWDDFLSAIHVDDRHTLLEAAESAGDIRPMDLRCGADSVIRITTRVIGSRMIGTVQDISEWLRLQRDVERQASQDDVVARLSQSALRGTDPQTLFRMAARRVAEVLSVDVVDVFRRIAGRAMQLVATSGRTASAGRIVLMDERSLIVQALATGETVAVAEVPEGTLFSQSEFDEEVGGKSGVMTSIFDAQWTPVGAIAVYNRKPTAFPDDTIAFLQSVASVLAQALDRLRADEEQKTRSAQQIAVAELARRAVDGVTPELLDDSCRVIIELLGTEFTRFVQRGDDGTLRVAAGRRWLIGDSVVNDSPQSQAGFTLRSPGPVVVTNYATEKRFNAAPFVEHGIVSGMSVAVSGTRRTFGVLAAHTRSPRAFTDADLAFVIAIADVIGEAMDRDIGRRELVESEERYRAVVEGASEIIYTLEATGQITSVNKAFEKITGWKREDWLGANFLRLIPETEQERARASFDEVLNGKPVEGEFDVVTAQGGVVTVFASVTPLMSDGRLTHIHGFARDVTATKAAEAERERLTRDMQLLLESTYEAICAVDPNGVCTLANRAAAALLGVPHSKLIGMRLHSVIHPECPGCPIESAGTLAQPHRVRDATFARPDGSQFPVDYGVAPIIDAGTSKGAVLTFSDVTETRKLEAQLEQAHRLTSLGRLAATMAHEFNNVLMGISPFVELLRRGEQTFERRLTALEHITKSVKRGKRISDEILRYTNPAEPVVEPVAVAPWAESFGTEIRSVLGPNYEVTIEISDPSLHVLADAVQLHQIFTNLALNARDAMPDGGPLRIAFHSEPNGTAFAFGVVKEAENFIHVEIEDAGYGIRPEVLRHIFEPLFTTKHNGTGLGLAVTHQVVKRHGGDLFVESTVGEGSTFHLFLPRAARVEAATSAEPQTLAAGKSHLRRVLLVEDEPAVASGVAMLLESEGIEVDVVNNGAEVLGAIERRMPDAVVLDIGLPDMDGTEVYAAIARTYPKLPVVFSTGHGDETQLETYLDNEHVEFLMKPYDIARLLESLQRVTAT